MPVHATNLTSPQSVQELDEQLSEPRAETITALAGCSGDLMILGAGGKMGPTLARMAKRALDAGGGSRRVLAVSRWTSKEAEREVRAAGIETLWEKSIPLLTSPPPVRTYPVGSWGPNAIHQLIAPNAWRLPFERSWREHNALGE